MEFWTSEIVILSQTGPWTPAQILAAREAVRLFLRKEDGAGPTDAEIDQCLERGLQFAKTYQRPLHSAAWAIPYYIGVEANPEDFEKLADKMRDACAGSGLLVSVSDYR